MDIEQKNHELGSIYNEYKGFFGSCELKLSSVQPSGSDDYFAKSLARRQSQIILTSAEGNKYNISVDLHGWYVINESASYETFEMLMGTLSPEFKTRFGDELSRRLQALQ